MGKSASKSARKSFYICNDKVLELKGNYLQEDYKTNRISRKKSYINQIIFGMADGDTIGKDELQKLINYRMYLIAKAEEKMLKSLSKKSAKSKESDLDLSSDLKYPQELTSDLENLVNEENGDFDLNDLDPEDLTATQEFKSQATPNSSKYNPKLLAQYKGKIVLYPRGFTLVDDDPEKFKNLSASLKGYYKVDQLLKARTLNDYLVLLDPASPLFYFYCLLCELNAFDNKRTPDKKQSYRINLSYSSYVNAYSWRDKGLSKSIKYKYKNQFDYFQKMYNYAILPDIDHQTRAFFLKMLKETQDKLLPKVKLQALLNSKVQVSGKLPPFFSKN